MCFVLLAAQQAFGMRVGQPAAVFGDADGDDLELRGVHRFHDRCGGEQRDFVLSGTSAEQDTYSELLHESCFTTESDLPQMNADER